MNATSHLKNKDHLLSRSEELIRDSSESSSHTASFDVAQDSHPLRTRRDYKMRQFYRDLQLWVEGDEV